MVNRKQDEGMGYLQSLRVPPTQHFLTSKGKGVTLQWRPLADPGAAGDGGGRFNQASKVDVASAERSQIRWESGSTTSVIFQPET